ncbi:5'-nucleotidase [bacterium]|nr:MAG: 5'-nucleotidase [bacterium]
MSMPFEERERRYMVEQRSRLNQPAAPGVGFSLCRKLLTMNCGGVHRTEVVALSRNDPFSGIRFFRSAKFHGLSITRGAFVRGEDPFRYLPALGASLFLSANGKDVKKALAQGIPAATVFPRAAGEDPNPNELRIAFDGDSVLFSDEAERQYKESGLAAFMEHEVSRVGEPLPAGPLQPFLMALHRLQTSLPTDASCRIITALVTARGAPAHERALTTLDSWGIEVNQAFFLDGLPKTPFLEAFQPDFFFDDQMAHIEGARSTVPSGHVDYGIANEIPPRTDLDSAATKEK